MPAPEESVRACLDGLVAAGYSPGIQYAHVAADAVCIAHHAGQASVLDDAAVSDRTTFNAYSVTKTFTAAAVLQLVEQGAVPLDAPIADYLPGLPFKASPTILQTLTHTGGLANPNPLSWCHLDSEHATFDAAGFVAQVLRRNARLIASPGARFRYSNLGYLLLGMLIERASGQSCTGFISDHLIKPLALAGGESLAFGIDDPEIHARGCVPRWSVVNLVLGFFVTRSRFIQGRKGRWLQLRNLHVNGAAYGGLIGNGLGLARYLRALLSDDGPLSRRTRSSLFSVAHRQDGSPLPCGLGWFAGTLDGESFFAHPGGAAGYYCEIRVYPRLARGSVVMTNRTGIRDERLLDRIDGPLIAAGRAGPGEPRPS